MDSFSAEVNIYMRCHKSALFSHAISLLVNYRFVENSDGFMGSLEENDNVVLE